MTDDQTQQYDTNAANQTPAPDGAPAPDAAPAAPAMDATPAAATATAAAAAPAAGEMAAPAAASTAAVSPTAAAGPSRARWFVAIGVAVVAIAAAIGAFLLLNSAKSPEALAYVPADAAMVVELRPELPGDQLQQLGNFLAHFPGFADQSTLSQKLDTALTLFFASPSGGGVDYTTRIKPWLNGPGFLAVRKGADAASSAGMPQPGLLLSATTTGQITCAKTFEGETTAPETYNGVELLMVNGSEYGCVIQGRQGLIGDRASLHAALDAKAAGSGMDKAAGYTKARGELKGDRLATMFINFKGYMDLLTGMTGQVVPGASNPFDALGVSFPEWVIAGLRAEGDAIVMDTVAPKPAPPAAGSSLLPFPPAHASGVAALVPADAVAFAEIQGAGVGIQNLITQLRSMPEINQQLQILDGMASMDTLVGWIQDAGIVVTGGDSPTVSMVLLAADDATAAEKGGSIGTVIGLAAMSGQGMEVHDETINGVKITTLTITDVGALTGSAGVPATGPVQVSFAVKGKAIMFGVGDGALAKLVNVQAGASLADDAAFKRVAARGVSPSAMTVYVAIPKLVALAEGMLSGTELNDWTTNVKPYIDPFEALYFVNEAEGDLTESTAILTVKTK